MTLNFIWKKLCSYEMKNEIIVKDIKVHYQDLCQCSSPKDTLVFLHGWGGTSSSWEKNITSLSRLYRCISVDFPGFGISDTPSSCWGVPEYTLFVRDFLNALSVEKCTLVGKSFGGRVAILSAFTYPRLLNKLILVAAAGVEGRSIFVESRVKFFSLGRDLIERLFSGYSPKVLNFFYRIFRINKEANPYKSLIKNAVVSLDLSWYARNINIPTLIIWGSNDQVLPLRVGQKLNRLIRGSVLNVIHDATHNVAEEKFVEVNSVITNFCHETYKVTNNSSS